MSPLTPSQRRNRERVEGLIRLAAPALDLVLAFGDRVSRIVEPRDIEYYPPRVSSDEPPQRIGSQKPPGD